MAIQVSKEEFYKAIGLLNVSCRPYGDTYPYKMMFKLQRYHDYNKVGEVVGWQDTDGADWLADIGKDS